MNRERGFTLLEVLVALAIALLAFAVIYRGSGEVLRTDQVATRTVAALAHAQSRLTALCRGGSIAPGTNQGDDGDGFTWNTTITARASRVPVPLNTATTIVADRAPPQRITLYDVVVQVTDADGRHVTLAGQCLGRHAEPKKAAP